MRNTQVKKIRECVYCCNTTNYLNRIAWAKLLIQPAATSAAIRVSKALRSWRYLGSVRIWLTSVASQLTNVLTRQHN